MSGASNSHQISLEYAEKRGRNRHLAEIIGTLRKPVPTSVYAAATNCLIQAQITLPVLFHRDIQLFFLCAPLALGRFEYLTSLSR